MDAAMNISLASGGEQRRTSCSHELEAKYVKLLEQRISQLESLVKGSEVKGNECTETKAEAQDLTSNDRIKNAGGLNPRDTFVSNGDATDDIKNGSDEGSSNETMKKTKIRFRDMKDDGEIVEKPEASSDRQHEKANQVSKPKDYADIIWTRFLDKHGNYDGCEVEICSVELQELFRVELAHDPRLHFSTEHKHVLYFSSPFEVLVHNWELLEKLRVEGLDSETWKGVEQKVANLLEVTSLPEIHIKERMVKAQEDLSILLNLVRATPGMDAVFAARATAKSNGTIQFNYIWTIFPPGTLVYKAPFLKHDQVFIVKDTEWEVQRQIYAAESESEDGKDRRKKVWHLYCWGYDWNGKQMERIPVKFKFEEFHGFRLINGLACHPLEYHFPGESGERDLAKLQGKLIDRGKRFLQYCTRGIGAQMFEYSGQAVLHGAGFQGSRGWDREVEPYWVWLMRIDRRQRIPAELELRELRGDRVMVDFESYIRHAPNMGMCAPIGDLLFSTMDDECRCSSCMSNDALAKNQRRDYDGWEGRGVPQSDEQYLLCPPRVLGYHLSSRTWMELSVNDIKRIDQPVSETQFQRLQLQGSTKDLIKSLVKSHTSGAEKKPIMEDIVPGKGKGLVILLHGPPGVGKTLTAESVASLVGKPLFSVSPSDIGMNPTEVESNLQSLFELAARWRAVLLFDEADVFLESRGGHTSDLTRNALVSVLLRVLEYYSGILILTTNRIKKFDVAVQSRVNLGIKFTDLDMDQKYAIYEQFIKTANPEMIENKDRILDYFKSEEGREEFGALNGRQVRNVLFSAASLALHDDGYLKREHIERMAKVTQRFQRSLEAVVKLSRDSNEV